MIRDTRGPVSVRSMTLEALADRYWKTYAEWAPTIATVRGFHDYDDRLRRFDEPWLDEMAGRFTALAEAAESLDKGPMTTQERITAALLTHECRVWATDIEHRYSVASIDPFIGPHIRILNDTRQNTVADREQADALLARYHRVGEYLLGALERHRIDAGLGLTPPAAALQRVLDQLDGYLCSPLADDPFLKLEVPGDDGGWREQATELVNTVIRPAVERYRSGLVEHIAPIARPDERCGLGWLPQGDGIYQSLIHKYTQLEMSPQQIHAIGLEWATEINAAEWAEIGGPALGTQDRRGVLAALRSEAGGRFGSEEEMLDHARAAIARAWDAVDDWFGVRPETMCDVVPVPPSIATAMPPAYYMQPPVDGSRPGMYFLNTYRPEERDRFEYESIHFHEAVPGHHFDRSLAAELDGIPDFRRYSQVFAHTEGWGLYAERLADEMGLYSGAFDRLGMVSADAWRAVRLVTDTGIHAMGWSRQQAIDFMREWTPIGQLTIEQEVDRYIGMPGQALAYKMGQLEIMRLRRHAETTLGSGFDIKGFHDTMISHGAMPLPLLSDAVEDWMSGVN